MMEVRKSVYPLVIANLVPLIGVVFFSWSLFTILLLYWLESAVIGGYNLLRIIKVGKGPGLLFYVPFFVVHYGMFMFVHLVFIYTFFGGGSYLTPNPSPTLGEGNMLWLPILAFVISHGVSYRQNFIGREEYKKFTVQQVMMRPYGRIVVMHLTVLFGGWLVMLFGAPVGALVIMILVKIAVDIGAHMRSHSATPFRLLKRVNYM